MNKSTIQQIIKQVFWLSAYALCAALPLGGAGILFAHNLPKSLSANATFMPSWFVLAPMAIFLLICGVTGFAFTRSPYVRLQDAGNALRVSSLYASMFVILPVIISVIKHLDFPPRG